MAERSGFFNALRVNGDYDRKYNANDYSDNLAVVIGNGVLRGADNDLRVTSSGMLTTVAAGRAWINGHFYVNDAPMTFAAVTAPAGGSRWDRVMLRLDGDITARSINLRYVQGVAGNDPAKPEPVRDGNIYELVLADIYIGTNATSVKVTDTRGDASICGWVYSTTGNGAFFEALDADFAEWFGRTKDTLASVTLFKRYTWRTVLTAAGNTAVFDIPQWDEETCFAEVYINGVLDVENVDYYRNGNVLSFANQLVAGTEIVVNVYKSIDGTGITSVAQEITELQNQVAALYKTGDYEYHCNGVDDNVQLSNLAQAWLDAGTDYASKTIRVFGTFGASAAVGGDGSASSPFRWFNIGKDASTNRRVILDFSCCTQIAPEIAAGTYNTIFYGTDAHIIGAVVNAYQKEAGTVIKVFGSNGGAVSAKNCRFIVTAYTSSMIANNGTFEHCRGNVANSTGNSYCFLPFNNVLLRVIGGEYTAYTGSSTGYRSAVIGQSAVNAVSILYGVNAPTIARAGYYQTHSLIQLTDGGNMNSTDLVSELPVSVVAGISEIRGTITRSKPGNM